MVGTNAIRAPARRPPSAQADISAGREPLPRPWGAALALNPSDRVPRWGRHPDVPHHGTPDADKSGDELAPRHTTLQLHGLGTALLHEAAGRAHALLDRRLIAHER